MRQTIVVQQQEITILKDFKALASAQINSLTQQVKDQFVMLSETRLQTKLPQSPKVFQHIPLRMTQIRTAQPVTLSKHLLLIIQTYLLR